MRVRSIGCVLAASVIGLAIPGPASAMGPDTSAPPPTSTQAPKQDGAKTTAPKKERKKNARKQQQSQILTNPDFRAAYELIYTDHDYAAGIAKLRTLGEDDHPDVANLIGYASRKLGRYDDSRLWYDRALAADPRHARTWSYYGMWHAEQGNLLKARDFLTKVASICGTECREYTELKGVIDGTRSY